MASQILPALPGAIRGQYARNFSQHRAPSGLGLGSRKNELLQAPCRQYLQGCNRSRRRFGVTPAADHSMIAHQVSVDIGPKRLRDLAGQPARTRRGIAGDRNSDTEQRALLELSNLQLLAEQR